jgi:hypothetical protein
MANEQNAGDPLNQAMAVALSALGWTLMDAGRADRLLALTGLSPAHLRQSIETPAVLAALLQFLESHEPDLVACATALQLDPAALVRARTTLEAQSS